MAPPLTRYILPILLLLSSGDSAAALCLTKDQARVLWPKQHLYWYSKDRCWSNRRGGPPRGIRIDPLPEEKKARAEARPTILPDPVYDVLPQPRPDSADDYCCWPPLESLLESREWGLKLLSDKMKGLTK